MPGGGIIAAAQGGEEGESEDDALLQAAFDRAGEQPHRCARCRVVCEALLCGLEQRSLIRFLHFVVYVGLVLTLTVVLPLTPDSDEAKAAAVVFSVALAINIFLNGIRLLCAARVLHMRQAAAGGIAGSGSSSASGAHRRLRSPSAEEERAAAVAILTAHTMQRLLRQARGDAAAQARLGAMGVSEDRARALQLVFSDRDFGPADYEHLLELQEMAGAVGNVRGAAGGGAASSEIEGLPVFPFRRRAVESGAAIGSSVTVAGPRAAAGAGAAAGVTAADDDEEDAELALALRLSLEEASGGGPPPSATVASKTDGGGGRRGSSSHTGGRPPVPSGAHALPAAAVGPVTAHAPAAVDADIAAVRDDSVVVLGLPAPERPPDAPSCSVCLEELQDGERVRLLPCAHLFHVACIDPWLRLKPTCPVCKLSIRDPMWRAHG